MAKLTGKGLSDFSKTKIGTPYAYGAKGAQGVFTQARLNALAKAYPNMYTATYLKKVEAKKLVGKVCCDCSGLISWYTGKTLSSAQLYQTAAKRMPMSEIDSFPVGTVLWLPGHVGVYNGKDSQGRYICTEEKGIDYGCVSGPITSINRWSYGLLFDYIEYDGITLETKTAANGNPYKEPTAIIKKGSSGESVKWVQYELIEAGFGGKFVSSGKVYEGLSVDGVAGDITVAAIIAFQTSCKITADGQVGSTTRKYLNSNSTDVAEEPTKEVNPYTEPTSIIRYGSTGDGAKWVQYELKEAGYSITIDGKIGNKSVAAIKAFQKANKLSADGKVGVSTRAKLKAK